MAVEHYQEMRNILTELGQAVSEMLMAGAGDGEMLKDDSDRIIDLAVDLHKTTRLYIGGKPYAKETD